MENRIEKGIVKFFDSRDNKRFGFIVAEGEKEIFFHFNDGENISTTGKEELVFSGGKFNVEPKKGDAVVFYRSSGYKGPKASPWGFARDYERAKKEIATHPAPTNYRVMRQTTVYGNPPSKPEIIWEGADVTKLSAKYQRTGDHRTETLMSTFSCGDFEQITWFECQDENGWKRVEDPRPIETGRRRRW